MAYGIFFTVPDISGALGGEAVNKFQQVVKENVDERPQQQAEKLL